MKTIVMAVLMLTACVVDAGGSLSGPRPQFQSPIPRYAIIYNDDRDGSGRFITVLMDPSEFSEANVRILFQMLSHRFSTVPKYTVFIATSDFIVSATEPDIYWANGVARVANRSLHAQGHVADRTEVTPHLVSAEPSQRSYAVSIEIETGPQLRVGTLQVVEATAFTPAELLKQIPLSPGEAFDDDKIWQGIASMKRLYGAKGYIDMTAGNTMSTHQNQPLLPDIYVQVVEGRQYRVGTVQILGLSATAENLLKSILEPGQIFDRQSFTDFLKEKRSLLPVDASDNDITVGRNHDDGILDIALDFRRCPGDKIPFPPVNVSVSVWDKYQFMPQSDRWFHVSD